MWSVCDILVDLDSSGVGDMGWGTCTAVMSFSEMQSIIFPTSWPQIPSLLHAFYLL